MNQLPLQQPNKKAIMAELIEAVTQMRGYQKLYFENRSKENLVGAKTWEKKTDELLTLIFALQAGGQ